jgi:hypothetical protein
MGRQEIIKRCRSRHGGVVSAIRWPFHDLVSFTRGGLFRFLVLKRKKLVDQTLQFRFVSIASQGGDQVIQSPLIGWI